MASFSVSNIPLQISGGRMLHVLDTLALGSWFSHSLSVPPMLFFPLLQTPYPRFKEISLGEAAEALPPWKPFQVDER